MTLAAWNEAAAKLTAPGAPFAWSTSEVRGVPQRVFDAAPASLRDMFAATEGFGPADYLVFDRERLSYAEVHRQVRALAAWMAQNGVGQGHRVAVSMRNYPEWVIAYWATVSMGAVVVGMNAWWTPAEMAYGLDDSTPSVLIVDDERWQRLASLESKPDIAVVVTRCDEALPDGVTRWAETVADPEPPAPPEVVIKPDDDLCVFYTSGTTGFPKGAVMTHRGAVHNVMNMTYYSAVLGMVGNAESGPRDRQDQPAGLVCVPLFHVTGCNCYLHPTTFVGGKLVLMYRWDPTEALRLIDAERPNTIAAVPSMSREIVLHPEFDRYDTSSLRSLGGGGSPLHPDLVGKIAERIPSGAPGTGYGLTETSGVVTMNIGSIYLDKPTTVGQPLPTVEAKVIDDAGNELAAGQPGELLVRSPIVIRGYLNKPEATAEAIDNEGWLRTGDIVVIDQDGFIAIVDRAKDLVIRGGENISCAEVENAIYEHDAVAETVVFAVPDERLGEVPGAAVVLRPGRDLDADALLAHLNGRLAPHKTPAHIWFLDDPLPRNASGKFLKRQVRTQLVPA